jgi:hypothetical protein
VTAELGGRQAAVASSTTKANVTAIRRAQTE